MSIRFDRDDWARVKASHAAWWKGELDRPLIHTKVKVESPLPACRAPLLSQANCNDFSYTPEELVERMDAELSSYEYYADSFPAVNFHTFGPGVAAAFAGAKLDNSSGSVWFFPPEEKPIEQISIRYDPDNIWTRRIKEIYRAGGERWQGNVMMSMPDLGGVMDIVATFVGTEKLLYALYDEPEEVKRLVKEAHATFMDAYRDLSSTLQEIGNPGFSDWDGLYSDASSYVLQSDFSYMIGPDMFREFVFGDLQEGCRELTNVIYHLDGVGQLAHLPQLLSMENLKAIQWVAGAGQPTGLCWLDVYKKIVASGRGCEVITGHGDFLEISRELPKGLYYKADFSDRAEAERFLKMAGVPLK